MMTIAMTKNADVDDDDDDDAFGTLAFGRAAAARRAAAGATSAVAAAAAGGGSAEGDGGGEKIEEGSHIAFLPASVLKFTASSKWAPPFEVMALEPHLPGEHVKHNDNAGRVETTQELPQAFSHFSLEASAGELCVCDIQGVGSFYTDPQIHSRDGEGFGLGNMGYKDGIVKFIESHVCNDICRRLGLKPVGKGAGETRGGRALFED